MTACLAGLALGVLAFACLFGGFGLLLFLTLIGDLSMRIRHERLGRFQAHTDVGSIGIHQLGEEHPWVIGVGELDIGIALLLDGLSFNFSTRFNLSAGSLLLLEPATDLGEYVLIPGQLGARL